MQDQPPGDSQNESIQDLGKDPKGIDDSDMVILEQDDEDLKVNSQESGYSKKSKDHKDKEPKEQEADRLIYLDQLDVAQ